MTTYAIEWGDGTSIRVGESRAYAEQLMREASGPFLAKNPAPRVVEVTEPTQPVQEGTTMTALTPEEFMLLPVDPDEDHEADAFAYVNPSDHTPLDRLADLEARVSALEGHGGVQQLREESIEMEEAWERATEQVGLANAHEIDLTHELADLEAKHDVVLRLVEEIRGIVKKSTSRVSLDVKAAIEAWANPLAVEGGDPVAGKGSHTRTPTEGGPDFCKECSDAAYDWVVWPCEQATSAQPAEHDADVEDWRAYAKAVHGVDKGGKLDFTVIDQMNRSQIRTMLGIEQPAGA